MTQQPRKKKAVESVKIDKEFRRIVETSLRRDLDLLEEPQKSSTYSMAFLAGRDLVNA
jgi:hypothetical protein